MKMEGSPEPSQESSKTACAWVDVQAISLARSPTAANPCACTESASAKMARMKRVSAVSTCELIETPGTVRTALAALLWLWTDA